MSGSWFEGIDIDAIPEERSGRFEALPQGNYSVAIESTEMKNTKAGTGKYISVRLKVTEGEYKNRLLFDNWNIKNPSAKCQEIGIGRMKRVFSLAGIKDIKQASPDDLNGKAFNVFATVKIYNGEDQNSIASYDMANKVTNEKEGEPKAPGWM